eukprot:CAMPEP_0114264316 /NCGR_PEP_ID=MMETSP0058-20121206/23116_1 /TAXON_ID=36894 /ORGANISM="Pyramimonas parkeae, CCMP726" /LENGTH=544 /DNA_ID=CAMNT_0001380931 /DNA_START=95 /DNA_END=1727 /DNA_ORIENTATION=+
MAAKQCAALCWGRGVGVLLLFAASAWQPASSVAIGRRLQASPSAASWRRVVASSHRHVARQLALRARATRRAAVSAVPQRAESGSVVAGVSQDPHAPNPSRPRSNHKPSGAPTTWALLVAGSRGWENYRHQASLYHLCQALHIGHIPDSQIVTMFADDIANAPENPFPGQVFNSLGGPDVYDGMWADYAGTEVTADNFFAALQGRIADVHMSSPDRRPKVLQSGPQDHVLVYFIGFASHGFLAMPGYPEGSVYADHLHDALGRMSRQEVPASFLTLACVVDAPRAASMFRGLLDKNLGVVAITASDMTSDTYAVDCDDMRFKGGSPCLGTGFTKAVITAVEDLSARKPNATLEETLWAARRDYWAWEAANASIIGMDAAVRLESRVYFGHWNAYTGHGYSGSKAMRVSAQTDEGLRRVTGALQQAELQRGDACRDSDATLHYLRQRRKLAATGGVRDDSFFGRRDASVEGSTYNYVHKEPARRAVVDAQAVEEATEALNRMQGMKESLNKKFDLVLKRLLGRTVPFEEVKYGKKWGEKEGVADW